MELISQIIGGLFLGFANYYIATRYLKISNKINFDDLLLIITYSFLMTANYVLVVNAFRILSGLLILIIIFKLIFSKDWYTTVITALISYFIVAIGELIFSISAFLIMGNTARTLIETDQGLLFSNLMIATLMVLIYNIFKKQIEPLSEWTSIKKEKIIIFGSILSLFFVGYFFFNIYNNVWQLNLFFLINEGAVLLFSLLVYNILKEKATNQKAADEYNQLLNYVKSIEILMDDYRKNDHEHLNQLMFIKGLTNQETQKYITNLIAIDYNPENKWVSNLQQLVDGGLKGLLYYKISIMKKNDINVGISISDSLKTVALHATTYHDVCKIIGIYLDNAYEAVLPLLEKEVIIEIYKVKSQTHIAISNTYKEEIETIKIFQKGYSTKGNSRGLGLAIAEDIIKKNERIRRHTIMQDGYFTQEIIIK